MSLSPKILLFGKLQLQFLANIFKTVDSMPKLALKSALATPKTSSYTKKKR